MGKKKPAPPPAPDYAAQAQAQGQANIGAAQNTASLSNPNVYGPYGSQEVSWDATGPNGALQPTIRQSLNPDAQAALTAQQNFQRGSAELGNQGLEQMRGIMATPFQYQGPGIQTSIDAGPSAQLTLGDYGNVQQDIGGYGSALRDLDLSGIANMPINAGMTAQNAIMSRLDPQLKRDEEAQRTRLINQGLTPGGEGFNADQTLFNQHKADLLTQAGAVGLNLDMAANQQGFQQALARGEFSNAGQNQNYQQALGAGAFHNQSQDQRYNQSMGAAGLYNQGLAQNYNQRLGAANFGNNAVGQSLQHQLALRNQPLNELNALMSSSQIQAPQFQQYSGANVDAAPIFEGAKAQGGYNQGIYGQQMAGYNSGMQGLASLGGAAMGLFSDVRLKSNIKRVGTHRLGIGVYEYDIFGHRQVGVMAHEVEKVRPEAVTVHSSGYKMVNYGNL